MSNAGKGLIQENAFFEFNGNAPIFCHLKNFLGPGRPFSFCDPDFLYLGLPLE
jgi:hypothetical protein